MTMNKELHPRNDVDRLHVSRTEERRGMIVMMMSRKCTVSTAVFTGVCTFDAEKGLSKSHFLYFFRTFLDRKGIVWI